MSIKFVLSSVLVILMVALMTKTEYAQASKYPSLTESQLIFQGDPGKWDANKPHTFSVVEANKDGYKYWAYYGLAYYGGDPANRKAGIARSNDLVHWDKYAGNPIINGDCRWPNVILVKDVFYMFYAEYDANNDSRIVMLTSKDGIHFDNKVEVVGRELGKQNQNPFVYFNKNDKNFYLAYYHGVERSNDKPLVGRAVVNAKSDVTKNLKNVWQIRLLKSKTLEGLKSAKPKTLISQSYTIAAPSIAYFNHKYYLTGESVKEGQWDNKWVTVAYTSDKIDGKYKMVSNNPILPDNDACVFQTIINNQLYLFYSHALSIKNYDWELRVVKATEPVK